MDKEMIKVVDENGVEREAEVVLGFEKDNKNFVVYTFNEIDETGMNILYSSVIKEGNGEVKFERIDEADWDMVKKMMNDIVRDWKEQ